MSEEPIKEVKLKCSKCGAERVCSEQTAKMILSGLRKTHCGGCRQTAEFERAE